MVMPFLLRVDLGGMVCIASAPTLVLAVMFMILYMVDQVHDLAEQMYLTLMIFINILTILFAMMTGSANSSLYGLFHIHIIIALIMDLFYVVKERGYALGRAPEDNTCLP